MGTWHGHEFHNSYENLTSQYYAREAQRRMNEQQRQWMAAHNEPRKERKVIEGSVQWCEADGWENGHAFSTKDKEAERIVRQHTETKLRGYAPGPVYQDEETVDEVYWICGAHKKEYGLFQRGKPEAKTKELPAGYDPDYVKNLEEENARLDKLIQDARDYSGGGVPET